LQDVEWVNLAQDGDLRGRERGREGERDICRKYIEITGGGDIFGQQREE